MSDAHKLAQTIISRVGALRAGRGVNPEHRSIPVEQLEALARAHLAANRPAGSTLAEQGTVYVTLAAAREYAAAERIRGEEEARRELTEILLDASSQSEPGHWRRRSRGSGLDLSAIVAKEGRLMVVTHIAVRDANIGGRRG